MSNTTTVRVGQMPGQINEFAVAVGTPITKLLEIAGLSAAGYEVKVDGTTASAGQTVQAGTNLVLLTKQVKGNADYKTIRVGAMPGQINEYAVEVGTSVEAVLKLANLSSAGYEIKIDGATGSVSSTVTNSTNLILLTKQVKGNADVKTVRVGAMPGQIKEFAVEVGSKVGALLTLAGLSATGFEIKADGQTASVDTQITNSTNLVLLTKQVKGNN